MYLIDTNVVSALRQPAHNPKPVQWIRSVATTDIYLSVATMAEIERGIQRQQRRNPSHAAELSSWLETVITQFNERILPITTVVARRWARLSVAIGHEDLDLAIAATALEYGLTVATRNVGDFLPAGVDVFDPFTGRLHAGG